MPADPPIGRPRLVKLVRDRVGELLPDSKIRYEPITDEEQAIAALRAKLVEEAVEYLLNPSIGELADVQEGVEALAKLDPACGDGKPLGPCRGKLALLREMKAKRAERGGFDGLVGMWVTTSASPRHEGEHARTADAERGSLGEVLRPGPS